MRKLRLGVIGVGYLGKFHAEKYRFMNDVDLVAVADINQNVGVVVASNNNTYYYKDYRNLFGKVDAVSIVTPTQSHYSIAKDFLLHGVHVMVEKPITTTIEDADDLIRIADSKKLIIQVGHLEHFNPVVVALREKIKAPLFIDSQRLTAFQERCDDVTVIFDLMIHDIDLILNFVKLEVKSIRASGTSVICDYDDLVTAKLVFVNGAIANMTASRMSTKSVRILRIWQSDAYISIDFANHKAIFVRPNRNGQFRNGMAVETMSFKKGDALNDELKSFVESVKFNKQPLVTGKMGRDALSVACSIMNHISVDTCYGIKDYCYQGKNQRRKTGQY